MTAPAVLTVSAVEFIQSQKVDKAQRDGLPSINIATNELAALLETARSYHRLDLGRADAGNWNELLQCARWVIAADENKTPGVSRQEAMRVALRNLIAAVGKFPHPCAAAAPPRSEKP